MFTQEKRYRKSLRRESLRVLYKASNIAKMKNINVTKFHPSQFLVDGKLVWVQYLLLKNNESRAEVAVNKKTGEAEIAIFCDKGYLCDLCYINLNEFADKRVKARLAMLKKQLEQNLAK